MAVPRWISTHCGSVRGAGSDYSGKSEGRLADLNAPCPAAVRFSNAVVVVVVVVAVVFTTSMP